MTSRRASGTFPAPPRRTLGARFRAFWHRPDDFLIDAGKAGEMVIARIRIAITLILLLIPLGNLAVSPPAERETHITGLLITVLAVGVAVLLYLLVARDRRQAWLPLATSVLDITLISTALLLFGFRVDPLQSVNSLVTFDTYFLAIAATCLRYDRRVALLAGMVAVVEYAGIVLYVALTAGTAGGDPSRYGQFVWSDQISRMVNLALATAIAVYIVRAMQKQRELSTSDALTGVFNRRFFDDYFANELERAARYRTPVTVAMIDVDHFKVFNDTYGHAVGDRALRSVARALQRAIRRSDLVARYGGEEFIAVFRETGAEQAVERVEAIRRAIEAEPLAVGRAGATARVTVSAGVASWPEDGLGGEELIGRADARLFEAKNGGRNRVVGPPPVDPRPEVA